MNSVLGNAGKTVRSLPRRDESPHVESIRALVESGVDTLVILGDSLMEREAAAVALGI